MTKVGQILEEEKQQAIEEAVKETWKQAEKEKQQAIRKTSRETARKMLDCGFSMEQILRCIDDLTRGELETMK